MKYKQDAAPTEFPITATEVKNHLKLDTSADDSMISNIIIPAVTDFAERHTRRAIALRAFTSYHQAYTRGSEDELGWWDGVRDGAITQGQRAMRCIEIPAPPLKAVQSVKTYDRDNTATTYDSNNYRVDLFSEPGRVVLNEGSIWPANMRLDDPIEVKFTAGDAPADVPYMIKMALLQLAAHWYENREVVEIGTIAARVPVSALAILDRYKVRSL